MNNSLLFCLLFFSGGILRAQTFFSGQLELGLHAVPVEQVGKVAETLGYPGLKNQFTAIQFGSYAFINRLVLGGKVCGVMVQDSIASQRLSQIQYSYLSLHLGYVVVETQESRFRLYPTAGIGYGLSTLRLDRGASFSRYVAPGALGDFALNASWARSLGGDPRNSLLMSVCAGYTAAFGGWQFNLPGTQVAAPLTGPYLRVGMGMCSAKR